MSEHWEHKSSVFASKKTRARIMDPEGQSNCIGQVKNNALDFH